MTMALGLMLIVYLDGRNPLMQFLTSRTSKIYILAVCVLCVLTAVRCIVRDRRK